ncbi:pentapeptide repeat-containing protein [Ruminiclostridium cellobioparum]|uniref:pentapeptide repeat-containing protein n=1 Tax=Ruminiclostridium cellobioparum TaxID=29355 RepID=UPI00138E213D
MFIGVERKVESVLVVTALSGSASFVSESISVSIITDGVSSLFEASLAEVSLSGASLTEVSLSKASLSAASSIAACNLPDVTINSELKPDMFPLRLYAFTLYVQELNCSKIISSYALVSEPPISTPLRYIL